MMQARRWALAGRVVTPEGIVDEGVVVVYRDRIEWVGPAASYSGAAPLKMHSSYLISPGFIDLHVHGGGGGSLCQPDAESMRQALSFHARHGTTGLLATFRTGPLEMMAATLAVVNDVMTEQRGSPAGSDLLGVHLEGPWLNPRQAGGQLREHMQPPSVSDFEALADLGPIRWATVAPELPGAEPLIRRMKERGLVVAAGHTAARYVDIQAALEWGVTHCSHFYNAMSGLHHREPGVVGAALSMPELHIELIADGIHVHPAAIRLAIAAKGWSAVSLVTDAVEFAGMPDGVYTRGGRKLIVTEGMIRLEDGTLAGSSLTMNRAVAFMVEQVGVPPVQAIAMASRIPAEWLGMSDRGSLAPGQIADLVVLDHNWEVVLTVVRGQVVFLHSPELGTLGG